MGFFTIEDLIGKHENKHKLCNQHCNNIDTEIYIDDRCKDMLKTLCDVKCGIIMYLYHRYY